MKIFMIRIIVLLLGVLIIPLFQGCAMTMQQLKDERQHCKEIFFDGNYQKAYRQVWQIMYPGNEIRGNLYTDIEKGEIDVSLVFIFSHPIAFFEIKKDPANAEKSLIFYCTRHGFFQFKEFEEKIRNSQIKAE